MKIGILGAGGVGGYYACALARAGSDVALVARGEHGSAIKRRGLCVRAPDGAFSARPAVVSDSPAEVGPVDALLVAVKSWQLAGAMLGAAPMLGKDTQCVPLLNGVEAHVVLEEITGRRRSCKGTTRLISRIKAPGVIEHVGVDPFIRMNSVDGSKRTALDALASELRRAGVDAQVSEEIDRELWMKFLFVCSLGGVGAVSRSPIGVVRSLARTRRLAEQAMTEIWEIARAQGIRLPRDAVSRALDQTDAFPAEGTSSLQRDIEAGVPSELDAWTGAAARLGRRAGVSTPAHDFILAALEPRELAARRLAKAASYHLEGGLREHARGLGDPIVDVTARSGRQ